MSGEQLIRPKPLKWALIGAAAMAIIAMIGGGALISLDVLFAPLYGAFSGFCLNALYVGTKNALIAARKVREQNKHWPYE